MRIRPAERADIPALAELVRRCDESQRSWAGPDVPLPAVEAEELEWDLRFARAGAWIRVAQEDAGQIVGVVAFAGGQISRDDRTPVPGLAHVSAVFVSPDHWRRGIARMLLVAAEEAMRVSGYERAQLWTLEGSPAERLYTALGWARDGRRDVFPPMGLDIVAYVKTL
ncbi:MAG TPA: GNAT family N-acetyltransferase [Baekduia sp.]|uniref:GNAT family N-acetyltransferase n=1 Tax=Baekduia sp. TaxID=2600305 RepID=UPI002CC0EE21|nr:GNAT family N-acetyltransferase [Baekduia sp.]HMJ37175.1 GNAT family N-acetyltransferase [Baekduia sp.]